MPWFYVSTTSSLTSAASTIICRSRLTYMTPVMCWKSLECAVSTWIYDLFEIGYFINELFNFSRSRNTCGLDCVRQSHGRRPEWSCAGSQDRFVDNRRQSSWFYGNRNRFSARNDQDYGVVRSGKTCPCDKHELRGTCSFLSQRVWIIHKKKVFIMLNIN